MLSLSFMAKFPRFEILLKTNFKKYFLSFKNLIKIHGNTFMDKLSNKTNFTEIRYDLKAQMAIRLRQVML